MQKSKNLGLNREVRYNAMKCMDNCKSKLDPYQIFDENVEDIAKCLGEVMLICGINTVKSQKAKAIIKRVFVYHEKLRSNCDPDKGNRLCRDDLLQALRIKCEMQGTEALLCYAIIKRAFKAFFHGKRSPSISNPVIDAMSIHSQENAWKHAAYRTARIFDNYRAAFFWAHKHYEKQIAIVYKELFKRMQARSNLFSVPTCQYNEFSNCELVDDPKSHNPKVEKIFALNSCENLPQACVLCGLQAPKKNQKSKLKIPRPITNQELNLQRCDHCHSPRLICECNIDPLTGAQFGECGQDSYKVKWYRIEDDLEQLGSEEECSVDWDNHHCPIDCQKSDGTDYCGENSDDNSSASNSICDDGDVNSHTETEPENENTDSVEKLEEYLNKLWAEEVAARNNPKTFKRSIPPPPTTNLKKC